MLKREENYSVPRIGHNSNNPTKWGSKSKIDSQIKDINISTKSSLYRVIHEQKSQHDAILKRISSSSALR